MTKTNDFISRFKILSNEPLFKDDEYQEDLDTFNHKAYADTIFELLEKNPPPLSIGLFGSWGIGKSSIIFSLIKKLKKENPKILPIYFNAWKYSGDSFRREFLLSVATQLKVDKGTIDRLRTLYHSQIKDDDFEDKNLFKQMVSAVFKQKIKIEEQNFIKLIITLAALAVTSVIYWLCFDNPKIFFIIPIGTLFTYIFLKQVPNIFELKKADIIDPKLIFPEQFEEEFN